MSRGARSLARLLVGLSGVVLLGAGSTAYASVPLPDPVSDGIVLQAPASVAPVDQGLSLGPEIGWMATGAAFIVVLGLVIAGIAMVSRRHHVPARRLQMP